MSDLIDRQAAIDIVRNRVKRFTTACVLAVTEIEKLPSAQPERENQKTALSVQIKVDFDDMKVLLEDIGKLQTYKLFVGDDMVLVDVEDIKDILAKHVKAKEVQSQRNTGKWIKLDMHAHIADHKCTACGQECYVPTCMGEPMYAYCPNCGADMREDGDADADVKS